MSGENAQTEDALRRLRRLGDSIEAQARVRRRTTTDGLTPEERGEVVAALCAEAHFLHRLAEALEALGQNADQIVAEALARADDRL